MLTRSPATPATPRAPITLICVLVHGKAAPVDGAPNGGYHVSDDRGAVTVGNEVPVWPSPGAQNRYDDVIGDFPV